MHLDIESRFHEQAYSASLVNISKLTNLDTTTYKFSRRIHQVLTNKNQANMMRLLRLIDPRLEQDNSNFISECLSQLSRTEALIRLSKFIILSFLSSVYIILSIGKKRTNFKRIIILNTPTDALIPPHDLYRILKEKIQMYSLKDTLLITKSRTFQKNKGDFYLCPSVIYRATYFANFNLKDLFAFYKNQFFSMTLFFRLCSKNKVSSALYKDFLSFPYIKTLDSKGILSAYIKTNSEYNNQEFWCEDMAKGFQVFTMYYSLNTQTFKYRGLEQADNFNYRISYFENAFTWSKCHDEWLVKMGAKKIVQTAPILLQRKSNTFAFTGPYITIFDITPCAPNFLETIFFDNKNSYYSGENCLKFINDIVSIAKKVNPSMKILLKRKRKQSPKSLVSYIDRLKELEKEGLIILIDEEASPEEIIKASQFIISMPFTSTNNVAAYYKIPSIYYDPSGLLDPTHGFDSNEISFAQKPEQLEDLLTNLL